MKIAVTGYASLDYVVMLDGMPAPGCTTTITERPADAWPRLGGSPAYVAAALVAEGVREALPVSWIGDDAAGLAYRRQLRARGIGDDGMAVAAGAATPVAILAYEPAGGCLCLYDPGLRHEASLNESQRRLISESDWVCVTIGPRAATEAVLDCVAERTKLAFVVKHDERSMPRRLAVRIAGRADLVFCSQAEAPLVGELAGECASRPGAIIIETHGSAGAKLRRGGRETFVAATEIAVSDPTGAGDSFAGGVLAAVARGETDATAILEAGHRAAARLLSRRCENEKESASR